MNIKVLGTSCKKCQETEKLVKEAVAEAGSDAVVEHVADLIEIAKYGVFTTPAIVIDGQVKVAGKIPTKAEIRGWLGK